MAARQILLLLAFSFATVLATAQSDANAPAIFTYRINHPKYGDIGTYTNTISRAHNAVIVDTRVRIAVKVAMVTLYRLDADRREDWRNGRLVAYDSTTEKNGETVRVVGRAEGDQFVVQGPKGTNLAPAAVWPANPWSREIVDAPVIMGTTSGRLYPRKIISTDEQKIEVGDRSLPVRHYRVLTDAPNDLWFDSNGRLVKFSSIEDDQKVTLTLE